MVYARKITRSKWEKALTACEKNDGTIDISNFPADTLTSDLRTSSNKLSVWCVESIEDAVLAMMANESSRIETIYILALNDLSSFELQESPGDTKVEDLIKKHRDIASLNYGVLGLVSKKFLNAFHDKHYHAFKKSDIQRILRNAIEQNRLSVDDLNESVQGSLSK